MTDLAVEHGEQDFKLPAGRYVPGGNALSSPSLPGTASFP